MKTKHGEPDLAAIEAGEAYIEDHLRYFSHHLERALRPVFAGDSSLSIADFMSLYARNQHAHGKHFVIHQHNHPIAGVHYDLRLQFSATSTVSFAIPYGVPGNPNSRRQGRMAIETRVHNLWNNLIESASHASGSLLIWDTGEYQVLPRTRRVAETDDEMSGGAVSDSDTVVNAAPQLEQNTKLIQSFKDRYIRLRLNGTRLPWHYTISMRLPLANDRAEQSGKPGSTRRRASGWTPRRVEQRDTTDSEDGAKPQSRRDLGHNNEEELATASDVEVDESANIRATNAYPGATNDIGSVHQRQWFMMLDKQNSGFVSTASGGRKSWVRSSGGGGFEPFFVRGAEVERSIVTGRLSEDIMADEGVKGFRARKMWVPVLE